ncbi:MAG TPA: protein kinase, partial [Vicinamibacterales bacterium]|nr:protein kinase [Vicinamibacterales bacterium]
MTADQWLRVKALFDEAVDRDPPGRAAFLAAACGGDAALRDEVERLLMAHDDASGFIEQSPVARTGVEGRAPLTGQTVGRYQVGTRIGTGGMGEVYAAKDLELGRAVAIKFALASDADASARLKREAQHASRLNHPHICTVHEVGTHHDHPFIVMELVEGQPLSELARGKGLPLTEVVRYGRQVADALAHAHRGGMMHRDLKSANVLITRDGRAKVLDFGLARTLTRDAVSDLSQSHESVTDQGAVAGTLSVLAPEILRGGKADERSDIWALGVLLYEMASGERPFRGATGFELTGAILHSPPSPLPDRVPSSLAQIVQRCLEKDPNNRYQHAGDVRDALAAASIDGPRQREPALVAKFKLPVVVAAILVGLAAFLYFARPADPVAVGESGRPAIAVMHFQHAGPQDSDTAWLSSGVPSMLVTGLAQTRGLEIVSERRLLEALGREGETALASLNKEEAANVARRAGAGAIVVGSIFRAGSDIRIDAQLEDLANGRVLAAKSVRGTDVFALVDHLAADIRDAVGLEDAPGVRNVSNVSSTSLEAYRLYSEGVKAASNVRMADADKLFRAAVAIDPSFAEAYMWLAHTSGALGRKTDRERYFHLALDNVDRLSERHRLMIDIQVAHERGEFGAARRLLDELLAKFPETEEAYQLALHLYQMGDTLDRQPERLLQITGAGAAALPSSSQTRNAHGYALLSAGRYAEAVREFEAYARIAPREPNPHDSLGEAHLKMGDAEKAAAAYSRALAIDPTFAPSLALRAWSLGVLGRYDAALADEIEYPHLRSLLLARVGRYREAAKVLAEGERQATAQGNHTRAGGLRHISAMLAIERGDTVRAL